jgi:hypothetical protein
MRIILLAFAVLSFTTIKSQTVLSPGFASYPQGNMFVKSGHTPDSASIPKWFLSTYRSISTGVTFFKGGSAYVFAAPLGLQLNRPLSNNLYAFANLSVSPAYISIHPSYLTPFDKNFSGRSFTQNSFGLYPSASLGLMYVNDAKTFSISGSISAERSTYPLFPYHPADNTKQNPVFFQSR